MASDKDDSNEISFFEGLRGMAHMYDLYHDKMKGQDPHLREKIDDLDKISVHDLLKMADHKVTSQSQRGDPHVEISDTHDGIEVAIDSRKSPVDPDNIEARLIEDNRRLRIEDKQVGWYTHISPNDDDEEFHDVNLKTMRNDITVVRARFHHAGMMAGHGGETDHQDAGSSASQDDDVEFAGGGGSWPETAPAEGDGEVPTFNEFIANNPWAEEMFENMAGPEMLEMFRTHFGDMKVTEIPKGPAELAAVDDDEDFKNLIESEWRGEEESPFDIDDDDLEETEE